MNNYQDKYGRFHHKPVTEKDLVPSNNGWIYTAYAEKVGIKLNYFQLQECFKGCLIQLSGRFEILRSPGKSLPPISRDEILGLVHLGLLKPGHLNGWNYSPFPLPKFSLFKLIPQLVQLYKNRHDRNYFWKNNLDQIYRFAFSVPLVDRHYINQRWGEFCPVYWLIAKIDSKFGKESGIRYLKYATDKSEPLGPKDLEFAKAMVEEFPVDHPIRQEVKL